MLTELKSVAAVRIEQLLAWRDVQRAFSFFDSQAAQITEEHKRICSIPASPFGEKERAEYLCRRFSEIGLTDSRLDEEGNCLAHRRGHSPSPLIVVSAHLDTVFPPETDFTVRRVGERLFSPGISDDGCGLAALLAFARAFEELQIETEGSLLFAGTVGEEGEGNLRGVKHLLKGGSWSNQISSFLSFDGPGVDRITNGAVGSRRYRVSLRGPGGHSWGDFGTANPVHALGHAISKLSSYPAPQEPRTTFNVGRVIGGASINSISREATMDVDLRSSRENELLRLDAFFRRAMHEAIEEHNAARLKGTRPLELSIELIGERPNGETPADSPIVEIACEATRAFGILPRLDQSSTDSNLPISIGLPAVTLGAGGTSGNSHTLEEWYEPTGRELGLKRGLLVILGLVGIQAQ
ncbi:MAG TPA: M20/M25/M40 family metallo-hydrolase [Pyrinomonadaceae bacterium]|nr:M20/M25/M40 family metallo-hydrolase [Pyrinomonadaceae bacterium]